MASHGPAEAIETGIRPPQERLGLSRQTTTALVRDLMTAGVVRWRYGRVTLLGVQALQALQALTAAPPNGS